MRTHSTRRLVILTLAGVAVAATVAVAVRVRDNGGDRISWGDDPAAAAAGSKPVLVDFTSDYCPACDQMKRTTWADPATAAAVTAGAVPVRVDVGRRRDLEQRYAIGVLPTLLLLAPGGHELRRAQGYQSSADVQRFVATR